MGSNGKGRVFGISGFDSIPGVIAEKRGVFPVHITSDNPPSVINLISHGIENRAEVCAGSLKREGRTVTSNKEERISPRPSKGAGTEGIFQVACGIGGFHLME